MPFTKLNKDPDAWVCGNSVVKTLVLLQQLQTGDVILTRCERGNMSPGYWNHAALITEAHAALITEAHPLWDGVACVSAQEFLARYVKVLVIRFEHGAEMAAAAVKYQDEKYKKLRFNCVSFVRKCYEEAYGADPGWRRPDHIADAGQGREVTL